MKYLYIFRQLSFYKLTNYDEEYIVNKNIYIIEGEKMITDLINDYFEFCQGLIKKSFIYVLEEKTNTLTEKMFNEQINFNITHKNTIEMKFKTIIQEEIKSKIEKNCK